MNEKLILKKIDEKVVRISDDECWIWTGVVNQSGRPKIHVDERHLGGKMNIILPHIFLFELTHGDVDARYLDNKCGHPRCINPKHHSPRTIEERLMSHVSVDESTGCWNWTGNILPGGYGYMNIGGKQEGAHRVSYAYFNGEIPEDFMVLHKENCHNRRCINPEHLYLGTHYDNMQDMRRADVVKGEKNGMAVLTKEKVIEIKRIIRNREMVYRKIAERFGVSRQAIKDIALGRTWAWVEEE